MAAGFSHRNGICAVLAALALTGPVGAPVAVQAETTVVEAGAAASRSLTVTGQAQMQVSPETAVITFGAQAEHKEASAAMTEVSRRMAAILSELDIAGIAKGDLQTRRIDLSPVWSHSGQNRDRQQITGFVATNSVELRVRDLDRLGEMLDLVLRLGANDMGGLRFEQGDPSDDMGLLRVQAVENAMTKARQLAEAAGLGLGPARVIVDGGASAPGPMMRMEMAASDVPVAPGEITLSHSVTVTFDMFVPEKAQ